MKINALIALVCCIFCGPQTTFAMHETQSTNELSSLENIDRRTAFETLSKPTKSTKTSKHKYSPRTSSPLARPTSASDISVQSNRYSPRTPSPLAHSISASDIAVDDISDEIPSEPISDTTQLLLIPQPARPTQTRSHRYSRRTFSPLSHSTSPSNLSDILDMSMVQSSIRSGGILIPMSVINNFPRALTLQTTHTPIESNSYLLPLISEIEIQPGSHEIKGLFRLKKYGHGQEEIIHRLTSIEFIDPTTNSVLKKITGEDLDDNNSFFGIKLQPAKKSHARPGQIRPISPFAIEPHQ